jgi:Uncharacterized conserved protein
MNPDILGWAATAILIATLLRQTLKQWKSPHPEAVSSWLFIGQMSASVLFTVYSFLLGNTVFVVTNLLLLGTAILGQVLAWRRRKKDGEQDPPPTPR